MSSSTRLTSALLAGALGCSMLAVAAPAVSSPTELRVPASTRADDDGLGPLQRRALREPGTVMGTPGQTSDGVRPRIARQLPRGSADHAARGDQRRHLRDRTRHDDPRVGPDRLPRPDPRQPAHHRPQRPEHLAGLPRLALRRTHPDRQPDGRRRRGHRRRERRLLRHLRHRGCPRRRHRPRARPDPRL
ncbi:hypothetical protein [Nocardioides sp. B-3]|uniref:hypothetical protein n=1 Tax=Nocardioides sp. B-3 TaxID=2895565 RepID=UPI0021530CCD|nr:hypothetical protein [Nocardioides sp. B-3]UUZ60513.1 hypothetical protein LP418_06470 [Nocardioides sp. B-3]